MSPIEAKSKPEASKVDRQIAWPPDPLLITLAAVALAIGLGRAMWDAYMGAPWTRDGTVRAYVVTMAPEVSGRVVELRVADNQFVHNPSYSRYQPATFLLRIDNQHVRAPPLLARPRFRPYLGGVEG